MMLRLELLWLALSYYTRLPVPKNLDYNRLSQASICLPLVGWVVGGLSGLSFYVAHFFWSQQVAVILALMVSLLLTGAFHEDGFADVCDGFGGGYGQTRILKIMKDSQIGAYGALGLVMLMLLKISVLSQMLATALPFILFSGHSVSRIAPLLIMRQYDYARIADSKSAVAVFKHNLAMLMGAVILACLPLLLLPWVCSLSIILVWLVNWRLGKYFFKHIGGFTGDCLGASQQTAEVVFYLSVSGLWKFI